MRRGLQIYCGFCRRRPAEARFSPDASPYRQSHQHECQAELRSGTAHKAQVGFRHAVVALQRERLLVEIPGPGRIFTD